MRSARRDGSQLAASAITRKSRDAPAKETPFADWPANAGAGSFRKMMGGLTLVDAADSLCRKPTGQPGGRRRASMVHFCSAGRARALLVALALVSSALAGATGRAQPARPSALPSPEQFFGYQMGADRKLANWDKLLSVLPDAGQDARRTCGWSSSGSRARTGRISRSSSRRRPTSPSSIGCSS